MTTSRSTESMTRKIMWPAVILLAAAAAACGGSTQDLAGTAPSQVSAVAAANDTGGSFSLLKEGKGKGRPTPDAGETPTTGTTPDPDDPEEDSGELGKGHGHGKAVIQYEGFTESITGDCTAGLIIVFKDDDDETTVKTDNHTVFQRAECVELKAVGETTPVHVHIAARMEDGALFAIYVRMQGPKFDVPDDAED